MAREGPTVLDFSPLQTHSTASEEKRKRGSPPGIWTARLGALPYHHGPPGFHGRAPADRRRCRPSEREHAAKWTAVACDARATRHCAAVGATNSCGSLAQTSVGAQLQGVQKRQRPKKGASMSRMKPAMPPSVQEKLGFTPPSGRPTTNGPPAARRCIS